MAKHLTSHLPLSLAASLLLFAGCFSPCSCPHHSQDSRYNGSWAYLPNSNSLAFYAKSGTQIGVVKMTKNKNFCRPSQDGKSLEIAPVILPPKTSAPTEEEYNEAGWFLNAVQPPSPPEGKVVSDTSYVYDPDYNAVVAVYTYSDPPLPTLDEYDAAMEDFLREEREARGYTTREPDSYLTSSVPRWSQDAKDWVEHRDEVMEYALDLINAVAAGLREPPTMAEFLANMPKIIWHYSEETEE